MSPMCRGVSACGSAGVSGRSYSTEDNEIVVGQSTPPLHSTSSLHMPTVSEHSSPRDNQLADPVDSVHECNEAADVVRTGGQVCTNQVDYVIRLFNAVYITKG
ncbi:hypothetical protein V6N13_137931 [Hibiscus sabdariffa]